jgi:cytochrome P450
VEPFYPIVSDIWKMIGISKRVPHVEYQPFHPLIAHRYGDNPPKFVGMTNLYNAILCISKPGPLEDMLVTKNKYIDKDGFIKLQFQKFLGESSLMVKNGVEQARKRKLIGSGFYKDKMLKMVEIIKKCVTDKAASLEERYLKSGQAFDIIAELDELHTRIIMTSAFGQENVADIKLPYIENGQKLMMPLGKALRDIFLYIAFRGMRYEISLIPYLLFFWYSSKDRECITNIKTVRDFCRDLIDKRRLEGKIGGGDLLSILMEDEDGFSTEVIIDECITFFLAGSQTVKVTNANILQHVTRNDLVRDSLMKELKT